MRLPLFAALLMTAGPALSQDLYGFADDPDLDSFVASNIIATFYHEAGHAVIDVAGLPVLGREEDAADTLMSLLIERLWDPAAALYILYDVTWAYELAIAEAGDEISEESFAGVHGLDQQRYYNAVCLFVGADPAERQPVAEELGLPESRAEGCEYEFYASEEAWATLLADVPVGDGTESFVLADPGATDPITLALLPEIAAMNDLYQLPGQVVVNVAPCGEANAYYYPSEQSISMCTEYADWMVELWTNAQTE
jgi:hypothetical protein